MSRRLPGAMPVGRKVLGVPEGFVQRAKPGAGQDTDECTAELGS